MITAITLGYVNQLTVFINRQLAVIDTVGMEAGRIQMAGLAMASPAFGHCEPLVGCKKNCNHTHGWHPTSGLVNYHLVGPRLCPRQSGVQPVCPGKNAASGTIPAG